MVFDCIKGWKARPYKYPVWFLKNIIISTVISEIGIINGGLFKPNDEELTFQIFYLCNLRKQLWPTLPRYKEFAMD